MFEKKCLGDDDGGNFVIFYFLSTFHQCKLIMTLDGENVCESDKKINLSAIRNLPKLDLPKRKFFLLFFEEMDIVSSIAPQRITIE